MAQKAATIALGRGEQVGASEPSARTEATAKDPPSDAVGITAVTSQVNDIAQSAAEAAEAHTHRYVAEKVLVDYKLVSPVAIARRVHEAETELGQRQHVTRLPRRERIVNPLRRPVACVSARPCDSLGLSDIKHLPCRSAPRPHAE